MCYETTADGLSVSRNSLSLGDGHRDGWSMSDSESDSG